MTLCVTGVTGGPHFVSTGTPDKKKAEVVCRAREKAALKTKAGTLTPDTARKWITEAMEDMLLLAGSRLPKAATCERLKQRLESKSIDTESSTATRYKVAVEDFLLFLGRRAHCDMSTLTAADLEGYKTNLAKRLSPATVNIQRSILRMALQDAVRLCTSE